MILILTEEEFKAKLYTKNRGTGEVVNVLVRNQSALIEADDDKCVTNF